MNGQKQKRIKRKPGGSLSAAPAVAGLKLVDYTEVDNPTFNENRLDDPNNPPHVTVKRAIRDDPLGSMRAHGNIDELQFMAGRHWQELYERASISRLGAMDTTKDIVDGGKPPEFASDGQHRAMALIVKARAALGTFGTQLVVLVLADGLRIDQAAAAMSGTRGMNARAIGFMFKTALDALVIEFGYSTAAPMKRAA